MHPLNWDTEARERAVVAMQGKDLANRDPEAAALLAAQLVAEEEFDRQRGHEPVNVAGYKPARAYAVACKEYGWTVKTCDEMHYLTFFAMLREAAEINREQSKAVNNGR